MDKNKLKVLREVEYTIPKLCNLCEHGVFPNPSFFGACGLRVYTHLKHTGADRQLSIYRFGTCPKWKPNEELIENLGPWGEFVDRREFTRNNRHKAKTSY